MADEPHVEHELVPLVVVPLDDVRHAHNLDLLVGDGDASSAQLLLGDEVVAECVEVKHQGGRGGGRILAGDVASDLRVENEVLPIR